MISHPQTTAYWLFQDNGTLYKSTRRARWHSFFLLKSEDKTPAWEAHSARGGRKLFLSQRQGVEAQGNLKRILLKYHWPCCFPVPSPAPLSCPIVTICCPHVTSLPWFGNVSRVPKQCCVEIWFSSWGVRRVLNGTFGRWLGSVRSLRWSPYNWTLEVFKARGRTEDSHIQTYILPGYLRILPARRPSITRCHPSTLSQNKPLFFIKLPRLGTNGLIRWSISVRL
jgi:hypothetical protein